MEEEKKNEEIDYKDLYLRALADYQNLQKRSLEEKETIRKRVACNVLRHVAFPMYNDFIRALGASETVNDGMHLLFAKLEKILKDSDIVVLDLKFFADNTNSKFDARYAEAVGVTPCALGKVNDDVQVAECGFMIGSTKEVISYAKVLVYKEELN